MVRNAVEKDLPKILDLLRQVDLIHHNGRPDIFKVGAKYNANEIESLIRNATEPILVAVDEKDEVLGYCFCQFIQHKNNSVLTDIKTLYIDDLCVDESCRGQHVGRALYEFCVAFARQTGCYNLTLNVWSCNESALRFYEKGGLVPQKIGMEKIL